MPGLRIDLNQSRQAVIALAAPLALAQGMSIEKGGMDKGMNRGGRAGASSQMHEQMMQGARQSMRIKTTGDVDRDFATMMRQHHETGIRMAQEEVQNGKDPQMKEMAQKILDSSGSGPR